MPPYWNSPKTIYSGVWLRYYTITVNNQKHEKFIIFSSIPSWINGKSFFISSGSMIIIEWLKIYKQLKLDFLILLNEMTISIPIFSAFRFRKIRGSENFFVISFWKVLWLIQEGIEKKSTNFSCFSLKVV